MRKQIYVTRTVTMKEAKSTVREHNKAEMRRIGVQRLALSAKLKSKT